MQVPQHEYRVVGDAGSEKVEIDVHLRGVTDISSIVVTIEPPHIVTVLVPDRYHLQLNLSVPISPHAESVRFKRRTGKLAMLCTVASTTEDPAAAKAEHEQLQEDAEEEAQPMQQSAAGTTLEQEAAEAAGYGAVSLQQQQEQQHQQQQQEQQQQQQPVDPKAAAAAWLREGQEAIANRHVKAAALALQMAAQRDPSGNISERQQLVSQLAALQQQRQQQQQQDVSHAGGSQQQAVQVDVDVNAPRKLLEIEETLLGTTPRQHSSTLVGRWCAAFDAFTLAWVRLGVGLAYWALSVKESKRVPFGPYGNAAVYAVAWLGIGLVLLSVVPTLLWQMAWLLPVSWIAATRVCWVPGVYTSERTFRDQKAATLIERQALRNKLQDNESLSAGLTKLLLAAISTAFVSSVVYTTFVWQLGSRSLAGWVLEVVLLAWRVVEWPWKLLVWKPPSWYPLQLLFAGLHSINCLLFATETVSLSCTTALVPLQIIITGGGWAMLCSFALSYMWRMGACWDMNWRNRDADTAAEQPAGNASAESDKAAAPEEQLPPWWHAAAAGMFPTIARSLLLLIGHWGPSQPVLSAVGGGVEAAVVLLAQGLGCTLNSMQAGVQLLSGGFSGSLARVPPGPLKPIAVSLLSAVTPHVTGLVSRLGLWWVQRAAGAVMGVLCWVAPAWFVEPLVQRACAASGVWQEGCLELLQPYAAQAPDSLSLSHSWWFTVIVHVWVGCILRQLLVLRACESDGRWLHQRRQRQQRLEAARQRKEQKVQQRRQQKRQGH